MENIINLPRQPRSLSRLLELMSQCDDKRDVARLGLTAEEERLLDQAYRELASR